MKMLALEGLALATLAPVAFASVASALGPVVSLSQGAYAGNATLPGVVFFGGLPYAQPPLGDLRWRPPAPLNDSQDGKVVDARNWAPICIQQPAVVGIGQEDCLTLNVWRPANATGNSSLPVIVYIHGGGNYYNSAQGFPMPDWVTTSNGGVVAVSIQYRLGLLGYLASTNRAVNSTLHPNVGLLDQRFALQWIQKNIAAFGGDPSKVTISGESSGGGSVTNHIIAYGGESNPPFRAVIGQSPANDPFPLPTVYEGCFVNATRQIGCEGVDDVAACLRSASVGAIVSAVNNRGTCKFLPIVDGDLIPTLPSAALKNGALAKVAYIGGHTTDDGSIFVGKASLVETEEQVIKAIVSRYKYLSNDTLQRMLNLYPLEDFASQGQRAQVAFSDTEFSCTDYMLARKLSEGGVEEVYNYRWDAADPVQLAAFPWKGVMHTSDLFYLFSGTNSGPSSNNALPSFEAFNTSQKALSTEAIKAWTSFAIDRAPLPAWEKGTDKRFVFRLGEGRKAASEVEEVDEAHKRRCEFWLSVGEERRL